MGNAASTRPHAPDVLVVVLDCVRAKSLWPWSPDGIRVPFLETCAKEWTVFKRCLSVASWSLPAHASLFTGKYPWNHRVFGRDARTLPVGHPTVADSAAKSGYRTLSLSANPFVSPKTSLTRGFDTAYWGDWASHYMRFLGADSPPEGYESPGRAGRTGIGLQSLTRRTVTGAANAAQSAMPMMWKWLNRFNERIRGPKTGDPRQSAPWIEPTLRTWLSSIDRETPVCCFVNLMDAHEPYLTRTPTSPIELTSTRLMVDGLDRTKLDPVRDSELVKELEARYLETIRTLDSRLNQIVGIFSQDRLNTSSLIIVTSDHGQSFGERGHVFHGQDTGEQLLRVPLLVKFPNQTGAKRTIDEWASLVDIAPTIAEVSNSQPHSKLDGVSLASLLTTKRREPVMAIGDGMTLFREKVNPRVLTYQVRPEVSLLGYLGTVRVEMSKPDWVPRIAEEGAEGGYDLLAADRQSQGSETVEKSSRVLIDRLLSVQHQLGPVQSVGHRLMGWGY